MLSLGSWSWIHGNCVTTAARHKRKKVGNFRVPPRAVGLIARSKYDDTRAETRFGFSAKRTSPFKSAGVSVQSTAGSRGVRISGQQLYRPCSDVQCKTTGYPLHSHLSPSLPLPCVTVCLQVLNALYYQTDKKWWRRKQVYDVFMRYHGSKLGRHIGSSEVLRNLPQANTWIIPQNRHSRFFSIHFHVIKTTILAC